MAVSTGSNRKCIQIEKYTLFEIEPYIWRINPTGLMRAGVHLIGSAAMLQKMGNDRSIDQAANVATLPGVLDPVLTMPDIHQGYGFPIGGVAAFHAKTGVISPGGVGYDINCGVRMLTTSLNREDVLSKGQLRRLITSLFDRIPAGVGSKRSDFIPHENDFETLLAEGSSWAIRKGFGTPTDVDATEERGRISGANPDALSTRARERGYHQLGTLGSGNHFVEIQYVDAIHDPVTAEIFGLHSDGVVVSIHTGSRGLGYQVCADYLEESLRACQHYGIPLVDRELAAAPLESAEGKRYLQAMAAAANFAFTNRQVLTHWVREVFQEYFAACEIQVLYDVCHNIAKFEELPRPGGSQRVCIHRKGATRAYPAGHPSLPIRYRKSGQPILVPGDMGRYSYILAGESGAMEKTFGSACHGAGRELSRSQAKKRAKGRSLEQELKDIGIIVRSAGKNTVLEEMPEAYKDVAEVVAATQHAGLARPIARLRPLGVVKG